MKAPETELRHLAVEEGMETLLACGLRKAMAGRISLEEMMRVVPYEVGARCCPVCLHPVEHFFANCPNCAHPLIRKCSGLRKKASGFLEGLPLLRKGCLKRVGG